MRRLSWLVGLAPALILAGCAASAPRSEWHPTASALGVEWTPLDSLNERLPETVRVLQGVSDSVPLRAWAARTQPGVPLRVLVSADTSDGREKPTEFAERTGACVVLNGGYFNMTNGNAVGLVALNGAVVSPAVNAFMRDSVSYVGARGAIGILPDGRVDFRWALDDGSRPCGQAAPVANHTSIEPLIRPPDRPTVRASVEG